jgi:FtsP/CotA-like multicopper oxidase with cupredoxin domain
LLKGSNVGSGIFSKKTNKYIAPDRNERKGYMSRRKFSIFMSIALALFVLSWGVDQGWAQSAPKKDKTLKLKGKVTAAEKKAAAARAAALGLQPGVVALTNVGIPAPTAPDGPGGIPHYFGPFGNWAYSPLPKGPITAVTLTSGGTGYINPLVSVGDVYGTGSGAAAASATLGAGGAIASIAGGLGGLDYSAPIVTIVDNPALCGGLAQPACGTGATATATIGGVLTGGIRKFIDRLPQITPAGANLLVTPNRLGAALPASTSGQYIPVAVSENFATPSLPVSDYYVIGLVEFYEKMHTDLPPTRQRGYVQLGTAAHPGTVALTYLNGTPIFYPGTTTPVMALDYPHYLGPAIVAKSNTPVRIKFYNLLPPTAAGGDLFLPVDETVAGSGLGPAGPGTAGQAYTQNRAAVHLHGNNTVWISDGTPHQWITPANETTPYPKGVSVRNVPDMPDPGPGALTIYYTNAMSARLMFYHDHAMGITRLNVYAGEAAGYVVTDKFDQDMINGTNASGVNNLTATPPLTPGQTNAKVLPGIGIPLVIQDRTFVDPTTIWAQDPTWNWGTGPRVGGKITAAVAGDLWYPHVYMSAQNPWDLAGANAFGRWHYGPWFINQTPTCVNFLPLGCIEVGPVPNPYYQPVCDGLPDPVNFTCTAPWEPPMMPGTPNPSTPGEAFMDTPIVNGTAYPYMEVEPKAYRFRVLNAGNDRFLNLQLYVAADKTTPTTAGTTGAALCNGAVAFANCTEVKMVPVSVAPANQQADWPSGIPDPLTKGPDWIQIGTEGGFLPAPVVIPQQPIGWNLNPTTFNYGNVNQHSLLLGTAERADVVVDFSLYAGKTLILYNDAPAAFPAGVAVYDYYTGVADQTDVGGAPTTQPGYGPNTRTIMQIRVAASVTGTPTTDVTLANLNAVFAKTATKRGVFEASQDPILVPQAAYNSAYNSTFSATAAGQYVQLADGQKTFQPINAAGVLQPAVTIPLEMKAMHDEMGGVYDTQFGRMSGMLGLTLPSGTGVGTFYGYASPPTDIHMGSVSGTQIGSLPDGTQIWRIFHNGVDTHTIHVHLFNAQLINRVGQDGIMLPPDPNELGWKDTFRVNPLEVTYIAMRPIIPNPTHVPFEVPDSVRLIDPTLPEGATLIPPPPAGWFGPDGVGIPEILNHYVNFGWEYVWHCHILAHEEMDMMHSLVFAVPPTAPTGLTAAVSGKNVNLIWTDNSLKEAQFTIQRATDANFTTGLTTFTYVNPSTVVPNQVAFQDKNVPTNTKYWYRVFAIGAPVGDTQVYPGSLGFPTMTASSVSNTFPITVGTAPTVPANPTNLTATPQAGPQVSLTWTDNATTETGFVVERCTGVNCGNVLTNFAQIATPGPGKNTGSVTYVDITVTAGNTYSYRVKAINGAGSSVAYTNIATAIVPTIPAAPTAFTVGVVKANGNKYTATLTWVSATNPTNFTIQRATNATFTTGLASSTVAGNLRTLTQTVTNNTVYYYRIQANGPSGSSAWANALPFPVRTGP